MHSDLHHNRAQRLQRHFAVGPRLPWMTWARKRTGDHYAHHSGAPQFYINFWIRFRFVRLRVFRFRRRFFRFRPREAGDRATGAFGPFIADIPAVIYPVVEYTGRYRLYFTLPQGPEGWSLTPTPVSSRGCRRRTMKVGPLM